MAGNNNVKVGITVTVFSVVLISLLLWLSQFKPKSSSYQLEGQFSNVGGLIPGSKVYFLGVTVGTVTATDLAVDKVRVVMDIDSKIKIPKNTVLLIGSKGVVGDKAVEFFIYSDQENSELKNQLYKDKDVIKGISPASFDETLRKMDGIAKQAQSLIGDPELNQSLKMTTKNVELFTKSLNDNVKHIGTVANDIKMFSNSAKVFIDNTNNVVENMNGLVSDLRKMSTSQEASVSDIIKNADKISKSLEKTASNINDLLENPQNQKDLKATVKNVTKAATDIQKIASSAAKLVDNFNVISNDVINISGDKELKDNLKDTVKNVKTLSDTFAKTVVIPDLNLNKTQDKKSRLNVEFKSEIFTKLNYIFKADSVPSFDVVGNFNMLAHTGFDRFPFLQLGIEELGAKNQINIQAGFYPFDNVRFSLGIVRGKLGIGGNYLMEASKTDFFADAYDISTPHIRLGVQQNLFQDFGATFFWDTHFATSANEFALGVRWQPSIF